MPLSTATSFLSDNVPVWIVSGIVLAGGWMFERGVTQTARLTTLEVKAEQYQEDVSEIKQSVHRMEGFLMEGVLNSG